MTIEIPSNYYSLRAKIDYLRKKKPVVKFPTPPKLPSNSIVLPQSPVEAIRTYAHKLLEFAEKKEAYNKEYEAAKAENLIAGAKSAEIEEQIKELIKDDVGLTKLKLPENKIKKIWDKTWQDADDEDEAIQNLREFEDILSD